MIETLTIESFKSIQSVTLELGQVNVFIGANGSGKSNILEALAVLSAAASGKVDRPRLVERGCRASNYFRPMFKDADPNAETRLFASGELASYDVSLGLPPNFSPWPWEFRTEKWRHNDKIIVDRNDMDVSKEHPYAGLAALRLVERSKEDPAYIFLKSLDEYIVYSADTHILHRWVKDPQEREPIGLGGGRLAEALSEVRRISPSRYESLDEEFRSCIDWYEALLLSPNPEDDDGSDKVPAPAPMEFGFRDRYFRKLEGRWELLNVHDVNEGALYLAFLAVLGLHPLAPRILAIENVDHGLNPLLAKRLMSTLTERILSAEPKRQVFLTTHNPLVLDGLPLGDDRVRLFTVDRDNKGHTVVKRFIVTDKHRQMAEKGWTLSRMWINKLIGGVPDV